MARIYLVRHAHAPWTPDEGRPLSAAGARAAEQVAAVLQSLQVAAIYSSPSRRAVDTVAPLAARIGIPPRPVADLRERELPVLGAGDFERAVYDTWQWLDEAPHGGESNRAAQARGLAAVQRIVATHPAREVVVSTHGTLLTLLLNAWDPRFGFEFWRTLSFPDVYQVTLAERRMISAERIWQPSPSATRTDGSTP